MVLVFVLFIAYGLNRGLSCSIVL